ncbi:MAG: transcription initiation factor IIB family protein [Candidatus Bathyarchaeia archaeon]
MNDEANLRICTRCGSSSFIVDTEVGEEFCGECGLVVLDNIVNRGPEWRAFTKAEDTVRSRVGTGTTLTLYDKGMFTVFRWDRDAKGNRLDFETINRMNRLKSYDNRSKLSDTWARNLSIAMAELERLSSKLHIPQYVKEHAALMYRQALKHDLIRGRSIDAFVAASIHAACRLHKVPRSMKNVSKASTREHSEISRSYRLLLRELELKMPIDDPMKFVSGIASKLKIRQDTERRAVEILRLARERNGLSGKDPRGVAAAALYKACVENQDRRIQKEVAEAAGTTEVTLRNRLRGLEKTLAPMMIEDKTSIFAHNE